MSLTVSKHKWEFCTNSGCIDYTCTMPSIAQWKRQLITRIEVLVKSIGKNFVAIISVMKSLKRKVGQKNQIDQRGKLTDVLGQDHMSIIATLPNQETHEELGSIKFWEEVHYNPRTKKWSCERAKDLYDEMLQLQQQPVEEGETPLTEKEIVERVLQKESGYVLGLGYGEKRPPSSKIRKDYAAEVERAKSRAEEAERRAEVTERRADVAERRVDHVEAELANVKGTLEQFSSIMEKTGAGMLGRGNTSTDAHLSSRSPSHVESQSPSIARGQLHGCRGSDF